MLLAIDIGNTNIVLGAFRGGALYRHWRIATSSERTSDEYGLIITGLLSSARIRTDEIRGAAVCSVVPRLDPVIRNSLIAHAGVKPLFAGADMPYGMPVLTDDPAEVGADRVVNAVAAYGAHRTALIVVDFGTAVTFDYVTGKGEYSGGVIAPGINISAEALSKRTAKLPLIEVSRPGRIIGKNTVDSMRSGLYWGFISLVDGILDAMVSEAAAGGAKGEPKIVATGGFAPMVVGAARRIKEADEFLTLKGLKIIYEGNR